MIRRLAINVSPLLSRIIQPFSQKLRYRTFGQQHYIVSASKQRAPTLPSNFVRCVYALVAAGYATSGQSHEQVSLRYERPVQWNAFAANRCAERSYWRDDRVHLLILGVLLESSSMRCPHLSYMTSMVSLKISQVTSEGL